MNDFAIKSSLMKAKNLKDKAITWPVIPEALFRVHDIVSLYQQVQRIMMGLEKIRSRSPSTPAQHSMLLDYMYPQLAAHYQTAYVKAGTSATASQRFEWLPGLEEHLFTEK